MANNTKQARKEAEYKRKLYYTNYYSRIEALFHNSVNVLGVSEEELPKRYLLKVLFERGAIAYDFKTGLYLPFTFLDIDQYNLPKRYELVGYKGLVLDRPREEVCILRANDVMTPIAEYVDIQINKLVDFDMAIEQNLEANKTMALIEVPDQTTLLTLSNLSECKQLGSAVAFVNKNMNLKESCSSLNTNAVYLVDKLQEARKQVWNETLNAIGISTANVDKRERVQQAEVVANDSYAKDCINVLVDTFNFDSQAKNLSIKLEINTTNIVATEGNKGGENE